MSEHKTAYWAEAGVGRSFQPTNKTSLQQEDVIKTSPFVMNKCPVIMRRHTVVL